MRMLCQILLLPVAVLLPVLLAGSDTQLPGFEAQGEFEEQVKVIEWEPGVTITINAPPAEVYSAEKPVVLIFYALPNGNTTEWTIGRYRVGGMHWRVDIQHIGAQTRALRELDEGRNIVTVYLETKQLSWPLWRRETEGANEKIVQLVEEVAGLFAPAETEIVITGHSGGGSFTWGFVEAVEDIPESVTRFAFLDSNYSYDIGHGEKFVRWLKGNPKAFLSVIAYDDREIMLDGKKVVSDTGGTWRATHRMIPDFEEHFELERDEVGDVLRLRHEQIEFLLHRNPENVILHTTMVGEMNGFLHAMTAGTELEERGFRFAPPRAYEKWIEGGGRTGPPPPLTAVHREIPPRPADAMTGTEFIAEVRSLPIADREAAIRRELVRGNIPDFLRSLVSVEVSGMGIDGIARTGVFQTMPDYLAIGSDEDYVRMPMTPRTAQAFCDVTGFILPTRKMVNDTFVAAAGKLNPQPLGEPREHPDTFLHHHNLIETQRASSHPGVTFLTGIKKDVVISNRLSEQPNRVAIYGWHYTNGTAIQPLTIIHHENYVDYSHGIRPVHSMMTVNGNPLSVESVLTDPNMHPLLSDEGVLTVWRYPTVEGSAWLLSTRRETHSAGN